MRRSFLRFLQIITFILFCGYVHAEESSGVPISINTGDDTTKANTSLTIGEKTINGISSVRITSTGKISIQHKEGGLSVDPELLPNGFLASWGVDVNKAVQKKAEIKKAQENEQQLAESLTTSEGIAAYANDRYSKVVTDIGEIELTWTCWKNTLDTFGYDYGVYARGILGMEWMSNKTTLEMKRRAFVQLGYHMQRFALDITGRLPGKKFTGAYDDSYEKYPNLPLRLQERNVIQSWDWLNYKMVGQADPKEDYIPLPPFMSYSQATVGKFIWASAASYFDQHDFYVHPRDFKKMVKDLRLQDNKSKR